MPGVLNTCSHACLHSEGDRVATKNRLHTAAQLAMEDDAYNTT